MTEKNQEPTCFLISIGDQHQIFEMIKLGFLANRLSFSRALLRSVSYTFMLQFSVSVLRMLNVFEIQDDCSTNLNLDPTPFFNDQEFNNHVKVRTGRVGDVDESSRDQNRVKHKNLHLSFFYSQHLREPLASLNGDTQFWESVASNIFTVKVKLTTQWHVHTHSHPRPVSTHTQCNRPVIMWGGCG